MPWQDKLHSDADAARSMQHSFLAIAAAPLIPFFVFNAVSFRPSWRTPSGIFIVTFAVMVSSWWLSLRFRIARRLLVETGVWK